MTRQKKLNRLPYPPSFTMFRIKIGTQFAKIPIKSPNFQKKLKIPKLILKLRVRFSGLLFYLNDLGFEDYWQLKLRFEILIVQIIIS